MLLLVNPLIGYSFFQAISLYGEASAAALETPGVAPSLSPLDGVLVPTFGSFYVAVTLLFPFVAIRALGEEKESGAIALLIQLPYRPSTLIAAKLAAVLAAWALVSTPAMASLVIWSALGGHLSAPETANLVLGHMLYGLLVGTIALLSASISDSAATAAIVALAVTIGSWVLDFTVAGSPGPLAWVSRLSLTQTLRPFEQGLLSAGLVLGVAGAICGSAALAGIWLPPGVTLRRKFIRSTACLAAIVVVLGAAAQISLSVDVSEDQRNSFSSGDRQRLATLRLPLTVTVHLAPEDPRYADLQRNVLSKLERAMPKVSVRLAASRQSKGDEAYGEVEYLYGARSDVSRSTSPREVLPLLYGLAGIGAPPPQGAGEYPGYPVVIDAFLVLPWYLGCFPLLTACAWWWSRRPPSIDAVTKDISHEHS
jgi:ABC-type transport system involved in multi-copper enzyme maturation permease subunit